MSGNTRRTNSRRPSRGPHPCNNSTVRVLSHECVGLRDSRFYWMWCMWHMMRSRPTILFRFCVKKQGGAKIAIQFRHSRIEQDLLNSSIANHKFSYFIDLFFDTLNADNIVECYFCIIPSQKTNDPEFCATVLCIHLLVRRFLLSSYFCLLSSDAFVEDGL